MERGVARLLAKPVAWSPRSSRVRSTGGMSGDIHRTTTTIPKKIIVVNAGDHAEEPAILISRSLLRMGGTYVTSIRLDFHYRLESFRFEDEQNIQLQVFVRVLNKDIPQSFILLFFSPKKLIRSFILKEVSSL